MIQRGNTELINKGIHCFRSYIVLQSIQKLQRTRDPDVISLAMDLKEEQKGDQKEEGGRVHYKDYNKSKAQIKD